MIENPNAATLNTVCFSKKLDAKGNVIEERPADAHALDQLYFNAENWVTGFGISTVNGITVVAANTNSENNSNTQFQNIKTLINNPDFLIHFIVNLLCLVKNYQHFKKTPNFISFLSTVLYTNYNKIERSIFWKGQLINST
jgi:hypothetical protein